MHSRSLFSRVHVAGNEARSSARGGSLGTRLGLARMFRTDTEAHKPNCLIRIFWPQFWEVFSKQWGFQMEAVCFAPKD